MAFSPFARFRNFTLENMKALLEIYPDMTKKMSWSDVSNEIEQKAKGYKKTAYQQACQFGLEDRGNDKFRIQNYLYTFDDDNLLKYMSFWLKVYFAPNPYINSDDDSMLIYCELAKEIINTFNGQVDFYDFFNRRIGGKSDDILLNALKTYAQPLRYKKEDDRHIFYVESEDIARLQQEIEFIESTYVVNNPKDKTEFFNRFSYENFCKFYGIDADVNTIIDEEDTSEDNSFATGYQNSFPRNRIVFGAPGTGKSHRLDEDSKCFGKHVERVTFHPSYSYANFVGTYKPTMTKNECDWLLDEDKKKIIAVLQDKSKTAQEKYDLLYDKFKDEGLTRLPILLGIYADEGFKTRKLDGTYTADDNNAERNHGKAIRAYLNLSTKSSNKEISYEYVPGPFMRIYTQAINHPEENFLLLIEEINRANVAAVFGDVFQLLDRKNGISQYPIATSEDVKEYLLNNLDCLKGKNIDELSVEEKKLYLEMRIPANMFIWATMNSADQGVFPMDTAFKRRWEFEYIGVDDVAEKVEKYIIPIGDENHRKYVKWNDLRVRINDILSSHDCKVNEDKLLGPFFITKSMLESACDNEEQFIKAFESKVIMYLFEDVMKMRPANIFKGHKGKMIFSEICKTFEEKGEELFGISNLEYTEKEEQE